MIKRGGIVVVMFGVHVGQRQSEKFLWYWYRKSLVIPCVVQVQDRLLYSVTDL